MPFEPAEIWSPHARPALVRLRTLILLRWIAVAGQGAAIVAASRIYGLQLDLPLVWFAVGTAVVANLVTLWAYPEAKRLSEGEAIAILAFDIVQLGFLIYLTGGLNNPFALLILGPVTIAATVLRTRWTVALGAGALVLATALVFWHLPLRGPGGAILQIPPLFVTGFWVAIVTGIVFSGAYIRRVAGEMQVMSEALLATQAALAREQKLTDLGGVVAAAAHELGTPLATIKLASAELADELEGHPQLLADARLIGAQADRCRDILRSMGRAGKDDRMMRAAPLGAVLREAAEPHAGRGRKVRHVLHGEAARQPVIARRPEIVHGLRNLIQNAVDFASSEVRVEARWDAARVIVTIADDGPGFPPQILGRIGDPSLHRRRWPGGRPGGRRPGYEGMGLGLFIAKTLLERTGAELRFDNEARGGARVRLVWPRERLESAPAGALGENEPFGPVARPAEAGAGLESMGGEPSGAAARGA